MQKISKLFSTQSKATLWYVFGNIFQRGIQFLFVLFLTRVLTTKEYGEYVLYQSWTGIIFIFTSLNLAAGTMNVGLSKFKNEESGFINSLLIVEGIMTLIVTVIILFNINLWERIFGVDFIYIVLMLINTFFQGVFFLWRSKERYYYHYKLSTVMMIIMTILQVVFAMWILPTSNHKLTHLIIIFVMMQCIVGLISICLIIKLGIKKLQKKYFIFAFRFSIPLIPHYLSVMVLQQSDRIMIGRMVSESKAGIYGISYNISSIIALLIESVTNSYTPYIYENMNKKQYKNINIKIKPTILVIDFVVIIFMLFAPVLVWILGGKEYMEAVWIIPPVAVGLYYVYIYNLFANIEFFFEKNKYIMGASLVAAIVNLLLNYLFIPICGYYVAGYTTYFCYMLYAIFHGCCYKYLLRKNDIKESVYDIKFILINSILLSVMGIISLILYKQILHA